MLENYIALGVLNILALVVLCYMLYQNEILDSIKKRYYTLAVCITSIVVLAEIGTSISEYSMGFPRVFNIIANLVGFSVSPFIPQILVKVLEKDYSQIKIFRMLPCMVNLVLTVLSPWFGFIFWISSDNVYNRGSLFFIYITSYIWSMGILLKSTLNEREYYWDNTGKTSLYITLFVFLGTIMQIFDRSLHTTWICVTFALALYYAFVCEPNYRIDKLTGILNRAAYERELKHLEELGSATIIYFDIDNFKKVNDTYGHPYGDYCLSTIASIIQEVFRPIGFCYRIGGDELCVLSEQTDEDIFTNALEHITQRVAACREVDKRIPMVSFGYSFYNQVNHGSITEAIKDVDKQLYINKAR